jgi:uncharacterized protein (TIGR02271 family)
MVDDRDLRRDPRGRQARRDEDVKVIPLVEERLSVGKQEVERARIRVHVQVDEREEIVRQELARDEVSIERVPHNVRISEIPQMRTEGTTTIIPVVEEVIVTEKMLMLVEEIHIHRSLTTAVHEIPVRLRSEHADIQHDREPGDPPETGRR